MSKYVICINPNTDINLIEDLEERDELEEVIDDEITECQTQIEYWCNDNDCDYDLFENNRCIVTTNSVGTDEEIPDILKVFEDNILDETCIEFDKIEDYE